MAESRSGNYLDEYDEATPMRRSYCQQLDTDEYERQASTATENALRDLLAKLDQHPETYYKILRQKKRDEMNEGGLFSYIKAQFFSLWKGEKAFEVDDQECQQTLEKTKEEMLKVFVYAQNEKGTHGRRCSQRLIEKRKRATDKSKHSFSPASPLTIDSTDREKSTCPPAVPIPPPPPTPKTRTIPQNKCGRTPLSPRNLCTSPLARKPLRRVREREQAHNLLDELKGSECRKRLRKTENVRSPGGTPIKKKVRQLDENVGMFNQKLIHKFRNVYSPSPGATSDTDSEFNSPV